MKKTLLSIFFASACMMMSAQDATVYFSEDFEWLEPWSSLKPAGQTIEENDADATAQQLGTNKVDEVSTFEALKAKGYDFVVTHHSSKDERQPQAQIYLQRNYLKFGLTGYQSGIVLPSVANVPAGTALTLTFDVSSQRKGNKETAEWDNTKLVVLVENGSDVKSYDLDVPHPETGAAYRWFTVDVPLTGATVTADTKITIRNADSQWPNSAAFRWFLDNIKLHNAESGAVADIAVDENAPVEYFNLLGVRVENPENGIYIRRQAGKVSKVLVK